MPSAGSTLRRRYANGKQRKRSFPKLKGTDPEKCAEAFDAQRATDEARGEWIDPRIGKTPLNEYAPTWMKSRLRKRGTSDTYELHLRNHILPALGSLPGGLAAIKLSAWLSTASTWHPRQHRPC